MKKLFILFSNIAFCTGITINAIACKTNQAKNIGIVKSEQEDPIFKETIYRNDIVIEMTKNIQKNTKLTISETQEYILSNINKSKLLNNYQININELITKYFIDMIEQYKKNYSFEITEYNTAQKIIFNNIPSGVNADNKYNIIIDLVINEAPEDNETKNYKMEIIVEDDKENLSWEEVKNHITSYKNSNDVLKEILTNELLDKKIENLSRELKLPQAPLNSIIKFSIINNNKLNKIELGIFKKSNAIKVERHEWDYDFEFDMTNPNNRYEKNWIYNEISMKIFWPSQLNVIEKERLKLIDREIKKHYDSRTASFNNGLYTEQILAQLRQHLSSSYPHYYMSEISTLELTNINAYSVFYPTYVLYEENELISYWEYVDILNRVIDDSLNVNDIEYINNDTSAKLLKSIAVKTLHPYQTDLVDIKINIKIVK